MRYIYIDKYGYGRPYINIHPLLQKQVKHLVDNIPEGTQYVYVFGSALLPSCRQESDLDVALVGEISLSDSFAPMRLPDCEYDILTFPSMESLKEAAEESIQNVARSILEEGLLVYGGEYGKE
jgi:predicted nucleotidyltransferase